MDECRWCQRHRRPLLAALDAMARRAVTRALGQTSWRVALRAPDAPRANRYTAHSMLRAILLQTAGLLALAQNAWAQDVAWYLQVSTVH
jgi:hypothetical protein